MTAPEDQNGLREALDAETIELAVERVICFVEAFTRAQEKEWESQTPRIWDQQVAAQDRLSLLINAVVNRTRAVEAERDAAVEKNEQLRFEIEALTQRNDELKQDAEDAETILQGIVAVTAARDAAEAEITRLKEGMEAAKPKVWVVTNNERGAERRYRMWSGRAWVWTPDPAQAAHFARKTDANQILPDGCPFDYADRIATLSPKEQP